MKNITVYSKQNSADKRQQRHKRVRAKVSGTKSVPRLTLYKSNKVLYAQLINDLDSNTIVGLSSKKLDNKLSKDKKTIELAGLLGEEIAKLAMIAKVKKAVFDRAGYKYHGIIKSFADGARKGGLEF